MDDDEKRMQLKQTKRYMLLIYRCKNAKLSMKPLKSSLDIPLELPLWRNEDVQYPSSQVFQERIHANVTFLVLPWQLISWRLPALVRDLDKDKHVSLPLTVQETVTEVKRFAGRNIVVEKQVTVHQSCQVYYCKCNHYQ